MQTTAIAIGIAPESLSLTTAGRASHCLPAPRGKGATPLAFNAQRLPFESHHAWEADLPVRRSMAS